MYFMWLILHIVLLCIFSFREEDDNEKNGEHYICCLLPLCSDGSADAN